MNWNYMIKPRGVKARNPIQGEYFASDAIKNPADALIRESIQNSLDARIKDENGNQGELEIRITMESQESSVISKWFSGAWEHINARGNGLIDPPRKDEKCNYLVIEDFNTTGLVGDILQDEPIDGIKNAFFLFFRAEGFSDKDDGIGRWGIGKHVFPRSSRANTFIGMSNRVDNGGQVLLGHSVFKYHRLIENGDLYLPDGYMGVADDNGFILPYCDGEKIEAFKKDFQLTREEESGLSVVVPWIDPEISEETVIDAVVRNYFYPILCGIMTVKLKTKTRNFILNADNIYDEAKKLDIKEKTHLVEIIEIAKFATEKSAEEQERIIIDLSKENKPEWKNDIISTECQGTIRSKLDSGKIIALKAVLKVRSKVLKNETLGNFCFYVWKSGNDNQKPTFIRDGLIITRVECKRIPKIRALVICESEGKIKNPLATLLGDSENPSHTEWNRSGDNFKGKYTNGFAYIDFVSNCVERLIYTLNATDEKEDFSLTSNFFPEPENGEERPRPDIRCKRCGNLRKDCTCDVPPPKKKAFRIEKVPGGFVILPGDPDIPLEEIPDSISVACAYDTRGGNPISLYEKSVKAKAPNFEIGKDGVIINESHGVEALVFNMNKIEFNIANHRDFKVNVIGFDTNRDLYIKAL